MKGALQRLHPAARVDQKTLEVLEEALISADVGPATTAELIEALQQDSPSGAESCAILRQRMIEILTSVPDLAFHEPDPGGDRPWVTLLVGVNGAGKTTTAAKLAARYRSRGCSVLLGAADTFRAAAVEQLRVWGDRLDIQVVAHQSGGDPAAVVYDSCAAGAAREMDVVLIDTAGRLQTKENLMAELEKIRRSAGKVIAGAPDQVWLVLDATTGQNGLRQAQDFLEHAGVTGLILAKLDGSAKGGVALSIAHRLGLPIRYVGTGEGTDDLETFDPAAFVDGLLGLDDE